MEKLQITLYTGTLLLFRPMPWGHVIFKEMDEKKKKELNEKPEGV